MNLRDLDYLIAVADLRSFVQAAERCCISQPTLSMQIKKLEEGLGVQIFERTNKKVLPTELGEAIIASARLILEQVDHIKQLAATAQDPLAGNVRFGAFPTLAPYLFPKLTPLLRQQLPRIKLILVEDKTAALIEQLKNGTLDVALLTLPVHDDYLQTQELFSDEFLLAVADTHPLAAQASISASDLLDQELLLLDEGHCLRDQALQVCHQTAAKEQNVRATSLETLRQMVYLGTGITLIPKIATHNQDSGIRYLPILPQAPKRRIALVWRKTCARLQLIEVLADLVVKAAQSI